MRCNPTRPLFQADVCAKFEEIPLKVPEIITRMKDGHEVTHNDIILESRWTFVFYLKTTAVAYAETFSFQEFKVTQGEQLKYKCSFLLGEVSL